MADLNVQMILRFVDRATAPARSAMRKIAALGGNSWGSQADYVHRGALRMAGGLGTVAGAATRSATVLAAYTGTVALLAGAFLRPAIEAEKFKIQLTTLEGSSAGAEKAMRWIETFATKTPLQLDETVGAYARLRAFGLDPTNGSLQALVDTMAATGGGAEQLDGLVLALGQSWTKGKLQGEEAMQMLERGVPVWDLLAKKMGMSAAQVQELATKGKLGREEITLLIEALGEKYAGASEDMSTSWGGVMSNIADHWSRFARMVMASGVFESLKAKLQAFLDLLNEMAADGRLQRYADQVAGMILRTIDAIWQFGILVKGAWADLYPILEQTANLLGGWDRLAWFTAALVMSKSIFGMISGFYQLGTGIALVLRGLIGFGVRALVTSGLLGNIAGLIRGAVVGAFGLLKGAAALAAGAVQWVARAFLIAGRAALANPLILVITAIAGLVFVIYRNWDGIVSYFQDKIDRVRAAFDQGLLKGVLKLLSEFNPFVLMRDAAEGLFSYLTGWSFADITAAIQTAFDIDLYQLGVNMMNSLWEGIKAIIGQLTAWVKGQLAGMVPSWVTTGFSAPAEGQTTAANMGGAMDDSAAYSGGEPGRALGGPVRAGHAYRWMEEGVEKFVPRTDGAVISTRQLRGAGGAAGLSLNLGGITINASPGMSPSDVARAVRRELSAMARQKGYALHDGGEFA